jgi:hypothetical protein
LRISAAANDLHLRLGIDLKVVHLAW